MLFIQSHIQSNPIRYTIKPYHIFDHITYICTYTIKSNQIRNKTLLDTRSNLIRYTIESYQI